MSHCYGYNSYSELLDAARKEREEKAIQLEMANLKYRIHKREDECFKLQKHVRKLEQQRKWLAEFISNAFAGITPAKQFIEWAEEATKE